MNTKRVYLVGAFAIGLTFVGLAFAQRPVTDIDRNRHGNLAAAQEHVVQAYNTVVDAQKANKEELGGHAEKAIELLDQANRELKAAAEFADQHHK